MEHPISCSVQRIGKGKLLVCHAAIECLYTEVVLILSIASPCSLRIKTSILMLQKIVYIHSLGN